MYLNFRKNGGISFMSETMDDYKDELDASFKRISEGDIIDCTVVGIADTEVTVDLQYNSAGIIRQEDFSDDPSFSIKQDVQIGDKFMELRVQYVVGDAFLRQHLGKQLGYIDRDRADQNRLMLCMCAK